MSGAAREPPVAATVAAADPRAVRLIKTAGVASVAVALTLIGLKLWAWIATDSVSLLSSLADSLLDLIASSITWFAVRVAHEPADREHRFGHGKSEAIAGLVQAVIVTGSALYVAFTALVRLMAPAEISEPETGVAVMGASLVLTFGLVAFQHYVVRRTGSVAIGADAVHYRADLFTALAVLAAIFLNARLGWYAADPLLGLVIVVLILASVRTITLKAIDILLDRELPDEVREAIQEIAAAHPAVRGVHDIRTRSSGTAQFIQLHLELDGELALSAAHRICDEVEGSVRQRFPTAEVIIHADPYGIVEARDPF